MCPSHSCTRIVVATHLSSFIFPFVVGGEFFPLKEGVRQNSLPLIYKDDQRKEYFDSETL